MCLTSAMSPDTRPGVHTSADRSMLSHRDEKLCFVEMVQFPVGTEKIILL